MDEIGETVSATDGWTWKPSSRTSARSAFSPGMIGADGEIERRRAARGRHVEDLARAGARADRRCTPLCSSEANFMTSNMSRRLLALAPSVASVDVDAAPAHVGHGRDARMRA